MTAGFVFCSEIRLASASRPPIDSYQSRPRAGNSPQKRLSLATGDGLRLRADVVQHRHLLDRPYKDHGGVLLVAFVLPIMIRAGDLVPLPQTKLQASRDVHFEAGRSRQADWISRGGKCTELLEDDSSKQHGPLQAGKPQHTSGGKLPLLRRESDLEQDRVLMFPRRRLPTL